MRSAAARPSPLLRLLAVVVLLVPLLLPPPAAAADSQGDSDLVFDNVDIKSTPKRQNSIQSDQEVPLSWVQRVKRQIQDLFTTTTEQPDEDEDDYPDHHENDFAYNEIGTNDDEDITGYSGDGGSGDAEHDEDDGFVYIRITVNVNEPYRNSLENHDSEDFKALENALAESIKDLYKDLPGRRDVNLLSAQRGFDQLHTKLTLDLKSEKYKTIDVLRDRLYDRIQKNPRLGDNVVSLEGFSFTKFEDHHCSPNEFKCDNLECVPSNAVCNNIPECSDHSDEKYCLTGPAPPDLDVDPEAIPFDKDDVTLPPSTTTTSTTSTTTTSTPPSSRCRADDVLRCGHTSVYVCGEQQCDGKRDCPNGEDEENCPHECALGEFACDVSRCIPTNGRCDGVADCTDGTDERECPEKCSANEFACDDSSKCIPIDQKCNGVVDCTDGTDERECPEAPDGQYCKPNQFRCNDGSCIDNSYKCDGYKDCRDGEDEDCDVDCDRKTMFDCGDGTCIPIAWRCNRINDCPNVSDEKNCPCQENDFYCKSNGICIPKRQRCDGLVQCQDRSDEIGCNTPEFENTTVTCQHYEWRCADGRSCVDQVKRCDMARDCADGSDERNCTCKNDEFRCNLGTCISIAKRCDGIGDCPFSEDEESCGNKPRPESTFPRELLWRCSGGGEQVVLKWRRCDGSRDCGDGSDEEGCESAAAFGPGVIERGIAGSECPPGKVRCNDGQCVFGTRCDNYLDCDNAEDEENCDGCSLSEFKCANSTDCIGESKRCDGRSDCPDGSDEHNCAQCPVGYFRCDSGVCIFAQRVCDGTPDCPDRSDESNCDKKPCKSDEFACANGDCIPGVQHCDSIPDCADNSDEEGCPTTLACNEGETSCDFGENCYSAAEKCDGTYDCDDRSDEENCPEPPRSCNHNEFECVSTKECIPASRRCDNIPDCRNGEDEHNCPNRCNSSEFQCLDGRCIPHAWRCDGHADCTDGSDERECATCAESDFRCADGSCVRMELRCDNFYDCRDFSDEQSCFGCASGEFSCGDGQCIPAHMQCDRRQDCSDNSDEDNCPEAHVPPSHCPQGSQQCRSGSGCYFPHQQCDGRPDCADGTDEQHCSYPGVTERPQLNLKTYPTAQDIKESREVVFQCRDEGPLRARVHWIRANGQPLPPQSRDNKGRLEIPDIQLNHSGTYICEAVGFALGTPGSQVQVTLRVEPLVSTPPLPQPSACQLYEATCSNGDCIPKEYVCDGRFHCKDGSDETRCSQYSCEPNEFRCSNKQCILKTWLCDGEDDCLDKSDELNCEPGQPGQPCTNKQFACRSGNQCIPKSFHCDQQKDCQDGSDEYGCSRVTIFRPPPPKIELEIGALFEISCTAVGIPTPEIVWRLNWGHIPEKCRTRSTNGTGTLTCPDIQEHDQGAYSCEAINSFGPVFAVPDTILTVYGDRAVCPAGFFNDNARREEECISCFCFGITTSCRSADLFIYQLNPPLVTHQTLGVYVDRGTGDFTIDRTRQEPRLDLTPTPYNTGVKLFHTPSQSEESHIPYFVMPENYNRNQLKSYGGYLKYNISFNGYGRPTSKAPDAIIIGNGRTLIHPSKHHHDRSEHHRNINYEIRYFPGDWFIRDQYGRDVPATREDIMMVLAKVEYILIKLQYVEGHIDTTLDNISMDSAGSAPTGQSDAVFVEECRCPVGYSGLSCEECAPGYTRQESGLWLGKCFKIETCAPGEYGDPARNIPCRPCPCPFTSPPNQFGRTCTLQPDGDALCDCPPGYTGRRCDQCASGYTGNPLNPGDFCRPSHCNPDGTAEIEPDGRCKCKKFVTGPSCNQCQKNSFHLSNDNQFGCISCFCMGITKQCSSSNWYRDTIQSVFTSSRNDFKIVDSTNKEVPSDQGIQLHQNTREIVYNNFTSSPDVKYWFLPTRYLGNKVTAYGGKLKYTLRYNPLPGGQSSRNTYPDVELISKNHIKLSYYHKQPILPNNFQTVSVPILEQYWQRNDGQQTYREHLLMALAELEAIRIKATYTTNTREVGLQSVSLEIADSRNTGLHRAFEVEECHCPEGYNGLSCERCAYGFKRTTDGVYLGLCERCSCNGYSSECDPETGDCLNCRNHTTGPECEVCAPGYIGDPINRIPCRYQDDRENCICDPQGSIPPHHCYGGSCQCKTNVEGQTCNRCRPGTFGLNGDLPDGCQSCFCAGVSTECSESNLYLEQIPSQIFDQNGNNGFILTDRNMKKRILDGFQPNLGLNAIGYTFRPSENDRLYWSLPNHFTGNKIKSYGGKLEFTQRYTQRPNAKYLLDDDVVITGNGITIGWSTPTPPQVDIVNKLSVVLSPAAKWQRLEDRAGPRLASREDILRVLANIDAILIRAQPTTDTSSSSISDITLDTAVSVWTGQSKAINVEECRCPTGYKGTSCEECDKGYYRDSSDNSRGPLGSCFRCPCNDNEESCQLGSDNRVQCHCLPGYYGADCSQTELIPTLPPPPPGNHTPPSIIVIIKEPELKIVSIGDTVTYYCEARAPHAVKIPPVYWTRDGGQLPDRATDDSRGTLIITDVRVSDSGRYICHATDGYRVFTNHVTLAVGGNPPSQPSSLIQPEHLEVREDEPFQLICQVKGVPHPKIHWERVNEMPLNPQHSISEEVLYIHRARVSDSGEYKCIAMNSAGTHESYAMVVVRPSTIHEIEPDVQPPFYSGPERQPFTLTCSIREPSNSIIWHRSGGALPYATKQHDGVLTFDDPTRQDSDEYICTITTYTGRTTSKSVRVTITSSQGIPPRVNVHPVNQTVGQGTNVEIHCDAFGSPTPNVKWTRIHEQLGPNARQIGNTLLITNVDIADRGVYICVADNEHGLADNSSALEVRPRSPPAIEISPNPNQEVEEGGNTFVQCRVLQGAPPPIITWTRPHGQPLERNVAELPGGVLRFNRVTPSDSGEYICAASNDVATVTATAVIQVGSRPTITIHPASDQGVFSVKEGDPIRVECKAAGSPTPSVRWIMPRGRDEIMPFSGLQLGVAVLEFHRVTNADATTYVCAAENRFGSIEDRIQINVYPSRGDITGEDAGSDPDYNVIPKSIDNSPTGLENVFTAYVGTEAEMRCRVENVPYTVRTKWVRADRRRLPEGHETTDTSLVIRNVQPSDAGDYHCITTDAYGNQIFNQTARLQVFAAPRIVLEPQSQTVRPNEVVSIRCRASGDEPISIEWHPVNRDMPRTTRIDGPVLEFRGIQVSDAGRYRCTARNMAGEADAVAEVIVNEAEREPAAGRDQTASAGSSATLRCEAGEGDPYAPREWSREHRDLPANSRQRGADLEIWNLTPEDAGTYFCAVTHPDGTTSRAYTNLHVPPQRSESNPQLIIQPTAENPREGDSLDVHCRSVEPGVITSWVKVNGRFEDNVQTSASVIRFINLRAANSGTYRCEARGYSSPYSKDYVLNIVDTHKESKAPMDIKVVQQGADIYLDCKSDIQGPITFRWEKQDGDLPSYVDIYAKTLYLKDVSSNDAGTYICTATDGRLRNVIPMVLVVTGIVPYFTQAPNSYISLPTIPEHHYNINLEISFKPETDHGLILFNGDHHGNYISLSIDRGYINFQMNLGKGVVVAIRSDEPVEIRQWHTIIVNRYKKHATIYVDGKGPYSETALGNISTLRIRDPLYLGGVPNYDALPSDIPVRTGFVGCISQFKVGSSYYDIMREAQNKVGVTNCETCQENPCRNDGVCQEKLTKKGFTCICTEGHSGPTCQKMADQSCDPYSCGVGKCIDNEYSYECHCPVGRGGSRCEREIFVQEPAFYRNAYIAYPPLKAQTRSQMYNINLKVKPRDLSDGLLLYASQRNEGYGDFLSIAVKDQHIEYKFGNSEKVTVLRSAQTIIPNNWVHIIAIKSLREGRLHVNGGTEIKRLMGPHQKQFHLNTPLYLGGVNKAEINIDNHVGVTEGFNGCISELSIIGMKLDIINSSTEAANVMDCTLDNAAETDKIEYSHDTTLGCDSNPCRNDGVCYPLTSTTFRCDCVNGYSGATCEQAPNQCDQLRPCQNGGTCRGSTMDYECTCPIGYYGTNCEQRQDIRAEAHFDGNGYLEFDRYEFLPHDKEDEDEVIAVQFMTNSSNGLIFWHGQTPNEEGQGQDYMSLAIVDGFLEYSYDLGSGPVTLTSKEIRVDDAHLHTVFIKRHGVSGSLEIDNYYTERGTAPGMATEMNCEGNIYLGGTPNIPLMTGRYHQGFSGCILQFEIQNSKGIDLGRKAVGGINVKPCPSEITARAHEDDDLVN